MTQYSYTEEKRIFAIDKGACPCCGQKIEQTESEKLIDYGATVKKCDKCGRMLNDTRVKELAIVGIQKDDTRLIRSFPAIMLFMGIVVTFFAVLFFVSLEERRYIRARSMFTSTAAIIFGPVFSVYGLYAIIKDIVTFSKRKKLMNAEMELSQERISNPEYMELASKLTTNERREE